MTDRLNQLSYNPDVLSCLANLSNDEVFTPPNIANDILDMLPPSIWKDKNATFLDPCVKTGVFLREIVKRLLIGLESEIPNLQERINHICTKQVFGIAITELTAYLSRRSIYCSKTANGKYSICTNFSHSTGNIFYSNHQHTWKNRRCVFCGAPQEIYERGNGLESYAYQFIHTKSPEEIFNMDFFDVIVGNPPYQLNDGGGEGSSATPIYQYFVKQAKILNPRHLLMIIPARWYSGGKGLDEFRKEMLHDEQIEILHDFPETADCFPNLNIRGGICYFLWSKGHKGPATVYNHYDDVNNERKRLLLEENTESFIRYNDAIPIFRKVRAFGEETFESRVSSRLPFGIPSNFDKYSLTQSSENSVMLYRSERKKTAPKAVYVSPKYITKNLDWKDKLKVLVSKASPGGDEYPHAVISTPVFAKENSVCTETYLIVDFVKDRNEANNLISYMSTRFFRFMMILIKNTQNISKGVFAFVPVQDLSKTWTDEMLYEKYNLKDNEIKLIESLVKPMEISLDD